MAFHKGQHVVCILSSEEWGLYSGASAPRSTFPQKGRVYTVMSVDDLDDIVFLQLEELPTNPSTGDDWVFEVCGFRPVKDASLDVFRSLLNPTPSDAKSGDRKPERVS